MWFWSRWSIFIPQHERHQTSSQTTGSASTTRTLSKPSKALAGSFYGSRPTPDAASGRPVWTSSTWHHDQGRLDRLAGRSAWVLRFTIEIIRNIESLKTATVAGLFVHEANEPHAIDRVRHHPQRHPLQVPDLVLAARPTLSSLGRLSLANPRPRGTSHPD